MVLPLLGGSPAVWSTAMVFYQAALLAGYAYAHWTLQRLGVRRQVWLHLAVLLVPFAFFPVAVPEGWLPPADVSPVPWLLLLLLFGVGIPFFAMATSSPILQRWFFATRHPSANDPYFLYAASNAGSVLALLSYPILIEPNLSVETQSRLWTWGYGIAFLITIVCARYAIHDRPIETVSTALRGDLPSGKPLWRLRGSWLLLAFIPCSLMLGVTTFITTDLAAMPLLWVIPLTLYLLSFIFVFSRKQWLPLSWMRRLLPILAVPIILILATGSSEPLVAVIVISLAFFFTAAMVCHGELAAIRPSPRHLTDFYLCLSLGGVLGGGFNALLAPFLFTDVAEYPIAVTLACLFGMLGATNGKWRGSSPADFAIPAGLGILTVLLFLAFRQLSPDGEALSLKVALIGIPVLLCYLSSRRPVCFGLGVGAILLAAYVGDASHGRVVFAERSFFGVHRITTDREERFFRLVHGNTFHGAQSRDPKDKGEPLAYYHRTGPIGQVFNAMDGFPENRIAAVGLGTGALAAYGRTGESWSFYEIDPTVANIARDTRFFTYLADPLADIKIILGDARLSLKNAPDQHYGLIVLDAYSSDAIPVHLLTREALQLYREKLAPGGLLALHISNLHLDLVPLAANLAHDAGLHHLFQDDTVLTENEAQEGKLPSQWILMAENETDLEPFATDFRWEKLSPDPGVRIWTDNFSSLFEVFRWHD
ncbi:MAG TPA: fused MFS/spermidine synthase [Opitutales bacterium]|nr:fused MFS/spermidine synthase [Opitutales bacterium]